VAVDIVYRFELIEIDQQDLETSATSMGCGDRLFDPVVQQSPIRESCQRVSERQASQARVASHPAGDVVGNQHRARTCRRLLGD